MQTNSNEFFRSCPVDDAIFLISRLELQNISPRNGKRIFAHRPATSSSRYAAHEASIELISKFIDSALEKKHLASICACHIFFNNINCNKYTPKNLSQYQFRRGIISNFSQKFFKDEKDRRHCNTLLQLLFSSSLDEAMRFRSSGIYHQIL